MSAPRPRRGYSMALPRARTGVETRLGTVCNINVCFGVTNVVLYNRRLPVNFRYAPFATEIARRCNMSRGPS